MKKLCLYLNGDRGLSVLENLVKYKYNNIYVFSKNLLNLNKYKKLNKIKYYKVDNINNKIHIDLIKKIKPCISIVAGFSVLFNEELINLPIFGTINLHAGPLPKYRGGSPLNWQIINGEKRIGISIIQMDKNIDTGKVFLTRYFILKSDDDISVVHLNANLLFSKMVIELLKKLKNKNIKPTSQKEKLAKYWHQRSDEDGRIFWNKMNATSVHNFIRAINKPYQGAFTYYKKYKIRIYKSYLSKKKFHGTPGRVVKVKNNNLVIICSDYGINVSDYKFENSNKKLTNGMHLS